MFRLSRYVDGGEGDISRCDEFDVVVFVAVEGEAVGMSKIYERRGTIRENKKRALVKATARQR